MSNLSFLWCSFIPISFCPITGHQREEINTFPSTVPHWGSCRLWEGHPLALSFLSRIAKSPQTLLLSPDLEIFHHLGHPSLDTLIIWCPSFTGPLKTAHSASGWDGPSMEWENPPPCCVWCTLVTASPPRCQVTLPTIFQPSTTCHQPLLFSFLSPSFHGEPTLCYLQWRITCIF